MNRSFTAYHGCVVLLLLLIVSACQEKETTTGSIDRYALVSRHHVILNAPDTLGSLSVGNGAFAFTVDVSGLQTFHEEYENGIALGTQAEWAWHSIPASEKYTLNDVMKEYTTYGDRQVSYAVQHRDGRAAQATNWLRANPHKLHLGLIGLVLIKENGDTVRLSDLTNIHQQLNLWTGTIESTYTIEGAPVKVELVAHQEKDAISARITSPLIEKKRLHVSMKFPYGKECHTCPGYDFTQPDRHHTTVLNETKETLTLKRVLDTTEYLVQVKNSPAHYTAPKAHHYLITPDSGTSEFWFTVNFSVNENQVDDFEATMANSTTHWKEFWMNGGAIDFSACTDPRAQELERRVVLSQYLTRIQCAGSLPPQETGLTMNSWFGKHHLEMHWWHGVHFALWSRGELLEKSLKWYSDVMEKAKSTAAKQGYKGARWQKMTDPYGNESPSDIGVFLVWQQPHPIYFAELIYRENPEKALAQYKDVVFETAEFMASFAQRNDDDGFFHLYHPIIPAQEIFKAEKTDDPSYELAYWHYGLSVAQQWRERLGMNRHEEWQQVLDHLAPYAIHDQFYLPTATYPDAFTNPDMRRDHPIVVATFGLVPWHNIDSVRARQTFDEVMNGWQWETTWGWDYPMMAMAAARIGKPEDAVNALFIDTQKNTYLVNGHNYQDKRLRLYLPGNGGLLTAVAMMAAGWDGSTTPNPGFPKDGTWNVKWEDLKKMP